MMDLQVIQQLQQTIGSEQLKNFFEMVYVHNIHTDNQLKVSVYMWVKKDKIELNKLI